MRVRRVSHVCEQLCLARSPVAILCISGELWDDAFQRLRAVVAPACFLAWCTLYVERRLQEQREVEDIVEPPAPAPDDVANGVGGGAPAAVHGVHGGGAGMMMGGVGAAPAAAQGPVFTDVGGVPLPVLTLLCGLLSVPVLVYLTRDGMPRWLRNAYVLPAFVSSIIWFEIAADELVEALRAFGHILDVSIAILGVTVSTDR